MRRSHALGFALALAAGFALGRLAFPPPASAPAPAEPRLLLPDAPPRAGLAPADDAVEVRSDTQEAQAPFPHIDVRVLRADGSPTPASTVVYAMAAGAPGTSDYDDVLQAALGDEGTARIFFPAAGLYDVGAVHEAEHVLATDVVVPSLDTLTLRLHPAHPIRLDVDETLADRLASRAKAFEQGLLPYRPARKWQGYTPTSGVTFRPVGSTRVVACPGRGDRVPTHQPSRSMAWIPDGDRYRVEPFAPIPVLAVPDEVSGPGTVRLQPAGALLRIAPRLRTRVVLSETRTLSVRFEVAGERAVLEWTIGGRPGHDGSLGREEEFAVKAEKGMLAWSGVGLRDGSMPFDGSAFGEVFLQPTLELVAVPPSQGDPASQPPLRTFSVRWVDPEQSVGVLTSPGYPWGISDADARGPTFSVGDVSPDEWIVVHEEHGSRITAPVRIDSAAGTEVALLDGGFLVPTLERQPPDGMTLRVRRADGVDMRFAHRSRGPEGEECHLHGSSSAVVLEPGIVLGPLEPGPIDLVVSIARIDVGTASVVVRSGASIPLVIPVRPAPGR
jgi:hypothetical protein